MLYAIIASDVENSLESRKQVRPSHLARLEQLKNEGRLVIAGPHPLLDGDLAGQGGFSGSLIVAEFSSKTDAEQWAQADPYYQAGIYDSVIVKPFKQVFP